MTDTLKKTFLHSIGRILALATLVLLGIFLAVFLTIIFGYFIIVLGIIIILAAIAWVLPGSTYTVIKTRENNHKGAKYVD
jgi:hypothetical protein